MTSQRARDRMVQRLMASGIRDPRVLEVMGATPRHLFVDEALAHQAYENIALPIGFGQTISQPYIVARMTEALIQRDIPQRVLELGTGSGYQAAILAQLVDRVISLERVRPLQRRAREVLSQMGLHNISLRHVDGTLGWPEHAPYDGIVLTAAPRRIPDALLLQLSMGGRLLAPVGDEHDTQSLVCITRTERAFFKENLGPVTFVPLLSGEIL
ncbi:protein-L-isoaspartate(D-aspartate) O-methyltransferase [Ectothiorhodospira magna]|nr:protein-L-isoaspartate(D-aspartate) O-methyltransferase [Ectothiorhodospira magna]